MRTFYLSFFIAFLLFQTALAQQPPNTVAFRNGAKTFTSVSDTVPIATALARGQFGNHSYVLLRFSQLPDARQRQTWEQAGIRLYDYIPHNSFLAEVPASFSPGNLKQIATAGVFTIEAKDKIFSNVARQIGKPGVLMAVQYFGSLSQASVTEIIKNTGAQVATTKIRPPRTVFVKASLPVLEKIAALPFVAAVTAQVMEAQPLTLNNRTIHGMAALQSVTGRNLQGRNVIIGVGDNGDPSTHIDISGRLIMRNPLPPANHSTQVTGAAVGGGILNPRQRGMAPEATAISQYYSDILVNAPIFHNDLDMVLTCNSYYSGLPLCEGDGEYNILSVFVDNQLQTYPELLHVFAAGNDGAGTCSPYPPSYATVKSGFQTAKNVLTVGGIDNINQTIHNIASRGPVYDGRLKPEIVAGSANVISTIRFNGYTGDWGTSMAAPTVTGAMALLQERYRQLHGGAFPPAALLKAVVCNGADDVGNPGPDYTFGFGTLNARHAVEMLENNWYFTGSVNHSGTVNFTINNVPAGNYQLKVMLYWVDPAGSPIAATSLVNNLDLTVTAPGGTVHRPLILNPDPAHVSDHATEGIDNLNNIEQVVIKNPTAGDYTVTVTGTNIPTTTQQFYVVYHLVPAGIVIEHPSGGETFVPGLAEPIRWHANDDDSVNTFTVQYSTNDGATWTNINNNVPATTRKITWVPANVPTTTARIRITRNNTGISGMSNGPFTILGIPTVTATPACPGYVQLTWTAVPSATGYEVLQVRNSKFEVIASTTATNYLVSGLSTDSVYYFSVQPLLGTVRGRPALARSATPNTGPCADAAFDNDLALDSLAAPASGRMFTATQLGVEAIQVRIRNFDNAASSGSFDISYQVNNGPVVTENSSQVIPSLGDYTYTFTQTFDFSATGSYTLKVWVTHPGDAQRNNDTLVRVIKHLPNDPIVLAPTFTEDFETADAASYITTTTGLEGLTRWDFKASSANGRARTFVNSGFARSGQRALTLDQQTYSETANADSLTATFNLSNYTMADQLWLDFYYRNQGTDFSLPGNQVWIRGSDADAWIPVFTLPTHDPTHFGTYRLSSPVNITETLANAVPAQSVSSSFQVRFGQEGFTSANSVITNSNLDDGFTFDDIVLTHAQNDVGIQALVSPDIASICSLGTTETIRIRVKNYSNTTINNVAVAYRINGLLVNETIPSLAPGQTMEYSFAQTANLAAWQRYELDAWVHYGPDNYRNNDSLLNIVFHTTPVITSYPYLQDFENNNGYWYTAGVVSSWEWGAPSKTIINKAASGNNAWVTSLSGTYNVSEFSYLYSPCFDLSGLTQPVLSFSHILQLEDNCDCDFHWVEYSVDDVNWIKLGINGAGTNWFDHATENVWQQSNPLWHVASYDIPVNASKVRFRFVMKADPAVTFEGIGIDDVHIFDKAAIYTGADVTNGLTQPVSGNDWVHFAVGGNLVASIHPNGQDLGNTSVKVYFNNTGANRHDTNQYYLDRNIVINPANVPVNSVTVRFYFTDEEANNLITATGCDNCTTLGDAYEAGVTQYSFAPAEENGTLSDNTSGIHVFIPPAAVHVRPYDNGYYAEFQVNNFSEFWINGGGPGQNQPLPALLGPFTVSKRNNAGLLEWTTLQESNCDRFIIEKSTDGTTYQTIGVVQAVGISNVTQQYQFTDPHLVTGTNYYRLRIADINGQFSFSPIRFLNISSDELIVNIYPNPVRENLLYINTSVECRQIIITDVQGRTVRNIPAQGTSHKIAVHDLARGTYFITIKTDLGQVVQRIVR